MPDDDNNGFRNNDPTPPFPPLRAHIACLRGLYGTLRVGRGQALAARMQHYILGGENFSPQDLSQCNTGKFRYREHHIKALHRVFGLDEYFPHDKLWGEWPASGATEDFVPRPVHEFKRMVEEARQKAPGMIARIRKEAANPLLQMTFISQGLQGYGDPGVDDPEHDQPEYPPIFANLKVGQAYHLRCAAPGRGRLAIVSSIFRRNQDGSLRKYFLRLNPLLRIPLTIDSEFLGPPLPAGGPGGRYEMLAFYWPAGITLPSHPGDWMFRQVEEAPKFDQDALDIAIRMVLEAQEGRSPEMARPEIALLDYFVSE